MRGIVSVVELLSGSFLFLVAVFVYWTLFLDFLSLPFVSFLVFALLVMFALICLFAVLNLTYVCTVTIILANPFSTKASSIVFERLTGSITLQSQSYQFVMNAALVTA